MMKVWHEFLVVGLLVPVVNGQMVNFKGVDSSTLSTGDLLDGADYSGLTTNVAEIPGLGITVWSGDTNQVVKTLVDSMGINRDQGAPEHIRLDGGEFLTVAFDKDIEITRIDFNHFDDGETMMVSLEDLFDISLTWSNLSHKGSDYLNTNIIVSAGTKITYSIVDTNSVIGLDGIGLTVIWGSDVLDLSVVSSNSMAHVFADFRGVVTTNYVLQQCTNLISSDWDTISLGFSVSTNWFVESTNQAVFFRAIVE